MHRRVLPALRRAHRIIGVASLTLWGGSGEASTPLGQATVASPAAIGIGASEPTCTTTVGGNAYAGIAAGCGASSDVTDPTDFQPGLGFNGGIAVGAGTTTTGANDIAIGSSNQAHGDSAIVFGVGATGGVAGTNVNNTITIGVDTRTTGSNGIAIGTSTRASDTSTTAVGPWAAAVQPNATAFGTLSLAAGIESTALGYGAKVLSGRGVSLGSQATAEGGFSVALGSGAIARSTGAFNGSPIAIGSNANATGVYGSPNPLDPNGSTFEAIAIGNAATATGQTGTALGWTSSATGLWSTAIGGAAAATGARSTAVGVTAQASGASSLAVGYGAVATHADSVALGPSAATTVGARTNYVAYALAAPRTSAGEISVGSAGAERQITNVAPGAAPTDAVNVSQLNQIAQNTAGSLGGGAAYDATSGTYTGPVYSVGGQAYNSVGDALGAQDTIVSTQGGSLASYLGGSATYNAVTGSIGGGVTINGNRYVTMTDAIADVQELALASVQYDNADHTQVTLDGATGTRITNLAPGELNETSTDAVNGSQLYQTNTTVNQLVQGKAGLVQQESAGAPITVGGNTGGSTVNMAGTAGDRRITGVADGVGPNDAATINQLNNLSQGVNGQVARLNNRIDTVQSRSNGGIAAAMAMATLPQAYLPSRSMLSLGGATWNGGSGYAVGLSTVSDNGSWVVKLSGGASSRGDYGGAVGVGYQW
ncbi:hypothetical protein AKI39_03080 [Bordetella sp. H567]|uniref:YadA family autotransporter adhesin n=1 Tax=Bordetella sp. H567 TaxID=1697043 RepID=UPI00081C49B4|nr:YadA-like family protein [Bordetella sp. H567]AOB29891.1 hypothetical protein AKI39_03080 [Bordetella sp. H567]